MKLRTPGIETVNQPLRFLVAGQANNEKMRFAATAPGILWLSVNADKRVLAAMSQPYVEVSSMEELFDVKVALDRDPDEREDLFGFPVDTLVIDSVDELQRILLNEHLERENRSQTRVEDWGWVSSKFHAIYGAFGKLDVHLISLCNIKDVPMGESETWIKPALQGSFADQIHRYMDFSLLLSAGEVLESSESPLEASVSVSDDDAPQVTVETSKPATRPSSVLRTRPIEYAQWIHDSTESLPALLPLDIYDFSEIEALLWTAANLGDGSTIVIDPHPPEPETCSETSSSADDGPPPHSDDEAPPPDADATTPVTGTSPNKSDNNTNNTEESCVTCGGEVDKNFILLAQINKLEIKCKKHFGL